MTTSTSIRAPRPTGVDIIDEQHASLHQMIVDFHEAHTAGDRPGRLVDRLSQIYQYAVIHFETEESLLERHARGQLERHRAVHLRLLKSLRECIVEYKRHGSRIPSSMVDKLEAFLFDHARNDDYELFRAVHERIRAERSDLLTRDDH